MLYSLKNSLSFLRLVRGCSSRDACALNDSDGAIGGNKCFVGHATNVCFGDLVVTIQLTEQLTPVPEACLECRKLSSQAGVVAQTSDQVGLGARLEHCEFFIRHIGGLQPLDLRAQRVAHFIV